MSTFEFVDKLFYKSEMRTQTYDLESIEEGRNILKDHIVYKDEDVIRVFSRICDHNGGKLGFQCRIDRNPDIYNVKFWDHFTNAYI